MNVKPVYTINLYQGDYVNSTSYNILLSLRDMSASYIEKDLLYKLYSNLSKPKIEIYEKEVYMLREILFNSIELIDTFNILRFLYDFSVDSVFKIEDRKL